MGVRLIFLRVALLLMAVSFWGINEILRDKERDSKLRVVSVPASLHQTDPDGPSAPF